MSRRKASFSVLVLLIGGLVVFVVMHTGREERDASAVVFTGPELIRGQPYARCCFTNGGTRALRVHIVRVQKLSNNSWQTISDEALINWPGLQARQLPIVEAGMATNFVVRQPDALLWRVCVLHGQEQNQWPAWKDNLKRFWNGGSLVDRSLGSRSFGRLREATSEKISR